MKITRLGNNDQAALTKHQKRTIAFSKAFVKLIEVPPQFRYLLRLYHNREDMPCALAAQLRPPYD